MATLYLDSGGASTNSGSTDTASPTLSGVANATTAAATTFVDANVTPATDVINIAAHGYISGSGVQLTTSGVLPAGLALLTLYFVNAVDANNITLHPTIADGIAGTNRIDITAAAGGGTHTVNNYTIVLGGSPDLSPLIAEACIVTTTGTSHVFTMQGGLHGLANGDAVCFDTAQPLSAPTWPTNLVRNQRYFANALTTTTFRIYSTAALAISGGASDINISTAPVQLLRLISDRLVSAINLASATNTGRKIFWVRAYDNSIDVVVVDTVVTGLGAGSSWAIGGQVNATGATWVAGALRGGEEAIVNTDLSLSGLNLEFGRNGTAAWMSKLTGKPGARRLLTNTSGGSTMIHSNATHGVVMRNLEFIHQGTGQCWDTNGGGPFWAADCRFTDSGATVIAGGNTIRTFDCEFSAVGQMGGSTPIHVRAWIHDAPVNLTAVSVNNFVDCVIDRTLGFGYGIQGTSVGGMLYGCTFYRSGGNGIQFTLGGTNGGNMTMMAMINNIILDNGDTATEANILQIQDPHFVAVYDVDNVVSIAGGLGGVNTLGYTLDASDITSNPLLIDPNNVSSSLRNYGLSLGSPAKGKAFSFLGNTGTTSYRDLGAAQSLSGNGVNVTYVNGIPVGGIGTAGNPWGPSGSGTPPVSVNVTQVNGITVNGAGTPGSPWGP